MFRDYFPFRWRERILFFFFYKQDFYPIDKIDVRNVIWGGITIQFLKFDPFEEDIFQFWKLDARTLCNLT